MPREVSRHDKTGENSRPTNKENSTPAHKPRRIAVRRKIISFDVHDASGTDGWPAPPRAGVSPRDSSGSRARTVHGTYRARAHSRPKLSPMSADDLSDVTVHTPEYRRM